MDKQIRFVGGPYDGHRQKVNTILAETVALPVNRDIFRLLSGLPAANNSRTTSVALYELEDDAYFFLGSVSPEQPV